jgi:ribosomal protein L34
MIGKLKKRKRLRVHGFLARKNTVDGQKVLRARRRKGRHIKIFEVKVNIIM